MTTRRNRATQSTTDEPDLTLLDLSYRGTADALDFAKLHMTQPLQRLAVTLFERGESIPFDQLSMGYRSASPLGATRSLLGELLLETIQLFR